MRKLSIPLALTVVIGAVIFGNLRHSWAVIPWLSSIGIWVAYFWFDRAKELQLFSSSRRFALGLLLLVLASAATVRLYKLDDFPLFASPLDRPTFRTSERGPATT